MADAGMAPSTPDQPAAARAGRVAWALVGLTVVAQMAYPLVGGAARDRLTVVTVCAGFVAAATHATLTRGWRVVLVVVGITAGGGLLVEAVGTATGFPFGAYAYAESLGPRLWAVPWVIPLAWTMMAWPAWLVAGRLVRAGPGSARAALRVVVAGWALASWDLFLDPQMVDAGHWYWAGRTAPGPTLPGVPGVPLTNYAGWLAVALVMALAIAVLLARVAPAGVATGPADAPMLAFYLWTYASSVLAHAAFFGLPGSAAWGALGMGLVALPLAVSLVRRPEVGPPAGGWAARAPAGVVGR
jgi:putative membrane protein